MGPRLLLSHTIAPIKNRSVCADFWSEKELVRFFLGAACDKKSVVCADSVREKIGPLLRLFLGAPYDKKSFRVRWALALLLYPDLYSYFYVFGWQNIGGGQLPPLFLWPCSVSLSKFG